MTTADPLADYEAYEERKQQTNIKRWLDSWHVPTRYRDALRKPLSTKPLTEARGWLEDPKRGWALVLAGETGTGKSVAAAAVLVKQAESLAGDSAPGFGADLREWVTGTEVAFLDMYASELRAIGKRASLVVDALGVEYLDGKGAAVSKFEALIEARSSDRLLTVITTNLSQKAVGERYGDRIADRLRDGVRWVACVGESLRGRITTGVAP